MSEHRPLNRNILDISVAELETEISEALYRELTSRLGYSFDDERIKRMAADVRDIVAQGFGGAFAVSEALDTELIMYGDPLATPFEPIGILNVK